MSETKIVKVCPSCGVRVSELEGKHFCYTCCSHVIPVNKEVNS